MAVAVDEPRHDALPFEVHRRVGGRWRPGADGGDLAVVDDQPRVAEHTARPFPERRVARVQLADVGDHRRVGHSPAAVHTARIDRVERGPDVDALVHAVADDVLAADDDVAHIVGRGGEHDRGDRIGAVGAGEARTVECDGDEVGETAGRERASRPPEALVAVHGRGGRAGRPGCACRGEAMPAARRARSRASPRTGRSPRASRSRRTARSRRVASAAVGPIPSASSRSVVAQTQHAAPPSASRRMSESVTWVACTAVNRSLSAPEPSEQLHRRAAVAARHSSFSAAARTRGRAARRRVSRPSRQRHAIESGSTARTEWIAAADPARRAHRRARRPARPTDRACRRRTGVARRSPADRSRRGGSRCRAA